LGGVLARKRPSAMRRRTTVGIDDDLATGHPGVTVRTAEHETASWVDKKIFLVAHPTFGQDRENMRPHYFANLLRFDPAGMLDRDDNLGRSYRFSIDVLQCDLALRVRAQQRRVSGVPRFGQRAQD